MDDVDPELIIRFLEREASESDELVIRELGLRRGEDASKLARARRIWAIAGTLGDSTREWPMPSAEELVEAVEDARPSLAESGSRQLRIGRRIWTAAAASLLLALGAAWWLRPQHPEASFGPEAFVTGPNEVATVTLADQTVVHLAPDSRLEFVRGTNDRSVSLWGRAYFAVTHRDGVPFHVRVPTGAVEVLGTRFEVQSADQEIRVAVVEGQVGVAAAGGRVTVGPNEVVRAIGQEAPQVERVEDVYQVIDWLGEFLAFESTPLTQVAEELERRFGIRIEIADGFLPEARVTGWFSGQTPSEMVTNICVVVNARCTVRDRDGTVRMEPSGVSSDGRALEGSTISNGGVLAAK